MKTTAVNTAPRHNLVPVKTEDAKPAKILYGVNGYSRIKEIFSIKPMPVQINLLEVFMHESELSDPNWFSSYE